MDLNETIEDLRREKQWVERVIATLEALQGAVPGAAAAVTSRRGRKSMTPEERREVSARMKRYWAKRLASRGAAGG
jgi:hypothetical protein